MAKKTKKLPEYASTISYVISMIGVLVIHYFFLANLNIHPTLNLFFSFLIFTLLTGVITTIWEGA